MPDKAAEYRSQRGLTRTRHTLHDNDTGTAEPRDKAANILNAVIKLLLIRGIISQRVAKLGQRHRVVEKGTGVTAHFSVDLKQSGKTLSELASVMTRYPQVMVNLTISAEGKIAFYTDREIAQKLDEAKAMLGKTGRIVVRPSGTEPLIRVMVEGRDIEQINAIAADVADVIKTRLASK